MKLSRMRGEKRARMICRLTVPLAALNGRLDAKASVDGAAWTELVLAHSEEALRATGLLAGYALPALQRMGDRRLRRILRRTLDGELLELLALVRQVGAEAVLAAVCQCGSPPTIRALAAWLALADRRHGWRHYTAEMLWMTARSVGGREIPRYSALMQAGNAGGASGRDLAQGLAAALRGKGVKGHQALQHDSGHEQAGVGGAASGGIL